MELDLLYKKFENVEQDLTLDEVKEKANLFLDGVEDIEELQGDFWIQLSRNWDLNIWWEEDDSTSIQMTVYPCAIGKDGYFHTDTLHDIRIM